MSRHFTLPKDTTKLAKKVQYAGFPNNLIIAFFWQCQFENVLCHSVVFTHLINVHESLSSIQFRAFCAVSLIISRKLQKQHALVPSMNKTTCTMRVLKIHHPCYLLQIFHFEPHSVKSGNIV